MAQQVQETVHKIRKEIKRGLPWVGSDIMQYHHLYQDSFGIGSKLIAFILMTIKKLFFFSIIALLSILPVFSCDKITFSVFAQNSTAATGSQETLQDQNSGYEPQSQTEGTI